MGNEKVDNILSSGISHLLRNRKPSQGSPSSGISHEFRNILNNEIGKRDERQGIELSLHAAQRIKDRNLQVDHEEFTKLKDGIGKLRDKGGRESLIVTEKGAYIVDIDKNKIVTAMDKNSLGENVFTKIDSTLFIN